VSPLLQQPARWRSIRWKLFALITLAVAVPVAVLTTYFPATHLAAIEAGLAGKASSLSSLLVNQMGSAIAFDDAATAREVIDAVSTDEDVVFVGLLRADGSTLAASGSREPTAPVAVDHPVLTRQRDRLRMVAPVVSPEGPRGLLLLELSTARATAQGARVRRMAALIGVLTLLFGCGAAWLVGGSLARRIGTVQAEARRVAGGDLSAARLVDGASDEIGQLARAFHKMVQNLHGAHASIEEEIAERTEELRRSTELYRALLENTEAIPWEMDVTLGELTYIGPQALTLLGLSRESFGGGSDWKRLVPTEDHPRIRAAIAASVRDGGQQEVEFRLVRSGGRCRFVRALLRADPASGGRTIRGFLFDVTARAELELELRQAQKLESVGRLASGIAHEINTPIQFVSDSVYFVRDAFASMGPLLERYRALGEALRESEWAAEAAEIERVLASVDADYLLENVPAALDRAIDGLGRVATIVRSMKEFAHPDHGKVAADLNSALSSTLVIARNEYKDIADVHTELGELPFCYCQVGELNQAFLNIIVNAAHAIADRGNDGPRGLITVRTRLDGADVVVEIADTGGGIPEDIRGRIFDPFFTTKEVGRGTGQGLAIARRSVVELHGGSLTFDTRIGESTTFTLRIPVGQEDEVADVA